MRMYDVILHKRSGQKLSSEEIEFFVSGFVANDIPDYQAAALLMAMFLNGLNDEETAALTSAMAHSGEMADLSALGRVADKHSTGGVADTTTFLVVPLVSSCGLKIAKMSGRGLGHTGGTLDKLEAIPGMNTALPMADFVSQIRSIGAAMTGQTLRLCPADKKIYALRDVTATVENIPLIASSIMSKKLASGADIIMLDVKTGNGAFMKTLEESTALARLMVDIGRKAGKKMAALISDMNQPLGNAVGNALEVKEAIEILQGHISGGDLLTVSMALSVKMLCLASIAEDERHAQTLLADALESRRALAQLGHIIKAQGGDARVIYDPSLLPQAQYRKTVTSEMDGYLSAVDCQSLGRAAQMLGAGRIIQDDLIDLSVGFVLKKRIGDYVRKGEGLCDIHANDLEKLRLVEQTLIRCFTLTDSAMIPPLIYATL